MNTEYTLYHILIDQKVVYVGMTKDPKIRWAAHCWPSSTTLMSNAIRLWGKECFEFKVIVTGSKLDIKKLEELDIIKFNTVVPFGCNEQVGDKRSAANKAKVNRSGIKHTTATKAAISATKTGKNKGELNTQAKLNGEKVSLLRKLYAEGVKPKVLMQQFDISRATVRDIVTHRSWKDQA